MRTPEHITADQLRELAPSASADVGAMLKPGGFLLSNNALLELMSSGMRSVGYVTTEYSDARDDGDRIVWYQAQ